MNIVSSFFGKIQFLFRIKWYFSIPEKKKIIIYDYNQPDILHFYFKKKITYYLYTRLEKINFYILIKSIVKNLWKWSFFSGYIIEYIKAIKPSLIITFIDNNIQFYYLKKFFPKIKIAFVQNGMRGYSNDIFGLLESKKLNKKDIGVDKMFVWNALVGDMYKKYLSGNYYNVGSIVNNHVKLLKKKRKKKSLLFISEFRNDNPSYDLSKDFYLIEKKLISFLYNFCEKNFLIFEICSNLKNSVKEFKFYKNLMPGDNWKFLEKKNQFSGYYYIDEALVTVFISSSLGYESISRGNKTAAFTLRHLVTEIESHKFGWPYKFPEKGKIWTNKYDEKIFDRILKYLIYSNYKDYYVYQKKIITNILTRNNGNKKFLSIISHDIKK